MKIEITATPHIVEFDGVRCRLWQGVTERGVPCKVFVRGLAVHNDHDSSQFEAELNETLPPSQVIDLRMVL